jgi:hypothetical protein
MIHRLFSMLTINAGPKHQSTSQGLMRYRSRVALMIYLPPPVAQVYLPLALLILTSSRPPPSTAQDPMKARAVSAAQLRRKDTS